MTTRGSVFIGLIDGNNNPTERWARFSGPDHKKVLREATISRAFSPFILMQIIEARVDRSRVFDKFERWWTSDHQNGEHIQGAGRWSWIRAIWVVWGDNSSSNSTPRLCCVDGTAQHSTGQCLVRFSAHQYPDSYFAGIERRTDREYFCEHGESSLRQSSWVMDAVRNALHAAQAIQSDVDVQLARPSKGAPHRSKRSSWPLLVRNTRGYIETIANQANGAYENGWYDAAAVDDPPSARNPDHRSFWTAQARCQNSEPRRRLPLPSWFNHSNARWTDMSLSCNTGNALAQGRRRQVSP